MSVLQLPVAPTAQPVPAWYATLADLAAGRPVEASQAAASAYAAVAAWDAVQGDLAVLRENLDRAAPAALKLCAELAERWSADGCTW